MCNISKIYNKQYIIDYLKDNQYLIVNVKEHFDKDTFNEYMRIYQKYKNEFLCDWFPMLWAIVFYSTYETKQLFFDCMQSQLGTDSSINSFNYKSDIKFEDNQIVIKFKTGFTEYIKFDQEKNVG